MCLLFIPWWNYLCIFKYEIYDITFYASLFFAFTFYSRYKHIILLFHPPAPAPRYSSRNNFPCAMKTVYGIFSFARYSFFFGTHLDFFHMWNGFSSAYIEEARKGSKNFTILIFLLRGGSGAAVGFLVKNFFWWFFLILSIYASVPSSTKATKGFSIY